MKKYTSPEIEVVKALDIVTTSEFVETDKIPFISATPSDCYQL